MFNLIYNNTFNDIKKINKIYFNNYIITIIMNTIIITITYYNYYLIIITIRIYYIIKIYELTLKTSFIFTFIPIHIPPYL